jgi:hypothetical protein
VYANRNYGGLVLPMPRICSEVVYHVVAQVCLVANCFGDGIWIECYFASRNEFYVLVR